MEVSDDDGGTDEKKMPPLPTPAMVEATNFQPTKRKMKTAFQLEHLEKTYAEASYPSEEKRAELSTKIALTDRQLQMWFCHRRLKDRKANEMSATAVSGSSSHPERKALTKKSAHSAPRKMAVPSPSPPPVARSKHHSNIVPMQRPTMLERRTIAFVEAQLGDEFRDDGPFLGTLFDPLPPGAFGVPLETIWHQNHPGQHYYENLSERNATESFKASSFLPSTENCYIPSSSSRKRKRKRKRKDDVSNVVCSQAVQRPMHEYHFLSEQPSVRSDGHERLTPPHFYDTSFDDKDNGGLLVHDDDQETPGYNFNDQLPINQDSEHGVGLENRFVTPDRGISWEEETAWMEKKRKIEDARIAKEVEAHEKRIRKELDKQDILKQKREEQMRKEVERHDREKKKEEDKLLREKQREEERYQRELKREHERKEKFQQKENLRAEKMRLKEEMRKEKEAARIKVANERAAARRIAKEYMDLIEDERLELMEIAASNKGLISITSLDSATLQNLNMFQEMLKEFPPKSVHLKQPFAVQPWADSNEGIGNLLMVWKFLITFADVLSLWPFTLDEFVQALHDYDPRLLGEIHISLLKCIIKDIEDVAPSISLGGNHNSAANPGIGHPQVVKGAYVWGFDIQRWKNHLNPLTWPEILRQFALCAGFGPQLKRIDENAYHRDEDEGHDGEVIISALRSGMAAENALAAMQEKGFSHLRRKRHRLTPGTVKFAAFHVLSLEGSKGLTILETADKIQKSGLRDLTTSKTPEASISAALSRDTKLFSRTAPSTYCVQTAYRKDPSDADSILATAREKMHMFENGYLEMEEAEKDTEDVDGAERDEEFESDDPEIDGINPEINFAEVPNQYELNSVTKSNCIGNGKEVTFDGVGMDPHSSTGTIDKALEVLNDANISDVLNDHFLESTFEKKVKVDDTEIDESNSGESWVQGLMEGEYSDISVEERLNALVSLVGVALEGNTIRVILEERLEAVNTLKKQMWAEAQLDKRRMKEECLSRLELSSLGMKSEMPQENIANMNGSHSPSVGVANKGRSINSKSSVNGEPIDLENPHNLNNIAIKRKMIGQDLPTNPDVCQTQQCGYNPEKSQSQIKSYISHKAEQVHVYRSLPLGQDRRHNRYWQFIASASRSDPGSGRIFFESRDGYWWLIDSEEAFDSLLAALDSRGIRESHLHSALQKIESSFKETVRINKSFYQSSSPDCGLSMDSPDSTVCGLTIDPSDRSSSFYIELGQNESEKTGLMRRYHDFQRWLWKNCFNSTVMCAMKYGKKRCPELLGICNCCFESHFSEEKHCSSCHTTFKNRYNFEVIFLEHVAQCEERQKVNPRWTLHCSKFSLPIRFQMLKMQLAHIEACIPTEALQPFWTDFYRKSWSVKLQSSSSAEDLFQILTLLESAVKHDCLSPNFETTNELLGCSLPANSINDVETHSRPVKVLPWIPHTAAAVGLRLMELDASIFYDLDLKLKSPKERDSGKLIKLPSKHSVANDIVDSEHMETVGHADHFSEYSWADPRIGHSATSGQASHGRGGYGRGRGGKPRSSNCARSVSKERERTSLMSTQTMTRGRACVRGHRTVRPRKIPQRRKGRVLMGSDTQLGGFFNQANNISSDSIRESHESSEEREELHGMETQQAFVEVDKVGYYESDDNDQVSGDEYDENVADYSGAYGIKQGVLDDESEEDGNGNDDTDRDYANEDIEDGLDEDEDIMDEDGDEAVDFDRNCDDNIGNDASEYSSSEYSD